MKLIDADINAQDYVKTWNCHCSDYGNQHVMSVDDVCTLPEIDPIHAAGGCYCKECNHHKKIIYIDDEWEVHDNTNCWCKLWDTEMPLNGFCSEGKNENNA